jgi:hypothetical protein
MATVMIVMTPCWCLNRSTVDPRKQISNRSIKKSQNLYWDLMSRLGKKLLTRSSLQVFSFLLFGHRPRPNSCDALSSQHILANNIIRLSVFIYVNTSICYPPPINVSLWMDVGADAPSPPHIIPSSDMMHREPMTTISVAAISGILAPRSYVSIFSFFS